MKDFVAQGGEFQVDAIDQTAWQLAHRAHELCPGRSQRLRMPTRNWATIWPQLDKSAGTAGNYLFYLAVADRFFGPAVAALGAAGLTTETVATMAPRHYRKAVRP